MLSSTNTIDPIVIGGSLSLNQYIKFIIGRCHWLFLFY